MLTNPEAASAASAGIARYEAQIAQAIPAADADLRAAIISAITLGITVSRHLIKLRRTRHRRPGAGHPAAAALRALAGSPPRPHRAALTETPLTGRNQ